MTPAPTAPIADNIFQTSAPRVTPEALRARSGAGGDIRQTALERVSTAFNQPDEAPPVDPAQDRREALSRVWNHIKALDVFFPLVKNLNHLDGEQLQLAIGKLTAAAMRVSDRVMEELGVLQAELTHPRYANARRSAIMLACGTVVESWSSSADIAERGAYDMIERFLQGQISTDQSDAELKERLHTLARELAQYRDRDPRVLDARLQQVDADAERSLMLYRGLIRAGLPTLPWADELDNGSRAALKLSMLKVGYKIDTEMTRFYDSVGRSRRLAGTREHREQALAQAMGAVAQKASDAARDLDEPDAASTQRTMLLQSLLAKAGELYVYALHQECSRFFEQALGVDRERQGELITHYLAENPTGLPLTATEQRWGERVDELSQGVTTAFEQSFHTLMSTVQAVNHPARKGAT